MASNGGELARMEARLAAEARRFKRKALNDNTASHLINHVVAGLTGIFPIDEAATASARQKLVAIIKHERGAARSNPFVYDLNRHIAASQALNALDSAGAGEQRSKANWLRPKQTDANSGRRQTKTAGGTIAAGGFVRLKRNRSK